MLYGIAFIVIAAFIALIVLNMRSGRPAKQPPRAQPSAADKRKQEPARAATRASVADVPNAAAPRESSQDAEPERVAEAPPRKPAESMKREQSDDEYRQALRSFSGQPARMTDERKHEDGGVSNTDDAYREGLRNLSKRK